MGQEPGGCGVENGGPLGLHRISGTPRLSLHPPAPTQGFPSPQGVSCGLGDILGAPTPPCEGLP